MKKIFGGINLTWFKVIILGTLMGTYTAIMALLPIANDTSFSDLTVTFEVWILFGIFIITNSKSALDSALKCFVFFLISQPLVYFIQDFVNHSNLFNTYYRYWFMWTIACLPIGYIGYYIKKDKWWGLLIIMPIMLLLGSELSLYLSRTLFSFPRHILTVIFCIATLIIYPLAIFHNKKVRLTGVIIDGLICLILVVWNFIEPPVYSTDILGSGEKYQFDNSYKVYLLDSKYGDLTLKYEDTIECWLVHADFKKAGNTEFVLESPNGDKRTFEIDIKWDTFSMEEKKKDEF